MIVDLPEGSKGVLIVIAGALVVINVAGTEVEGKIPGRHDHEIRVQFGETIRSHRNLGSHAKVQPTHRHKGEAVVQVGNRAVEVRINPVHISKGIEEKPVVRVTITTGLEAVAGTKAPNCPGIDGIDGRELREVERFQLGRARLISRAGLGVRIIGRKSVELKHLVHIGTTGINIGKVTVRLEDMPETVQAQPAGLDSFKAPGDLKGVFQSHIENRTECIARVVKCVADGNVGV